MEPGKIETKRLEMVGVEMYVSLEENFASKLYAMRSEIRARLDEIKLKKNNRHIEFWQWQFFPEEGYNLHRNYFCGVEVSDFRPLVEFFKGYDSIYEALEVRGPASGIYQSMARTLKKSVRAV